MALKIEASPNSNWALREAFVGELEVVRLVSGKPVLLYHSGNFELLLRRDSIGGIRFKVDEDRVVYGVFLSGQVGAPDLRRGLRTDRCRG